MWHDSYTTTDDDGKFDSYGQVWFESNESTHSQLRRGKPCHPFVPRIACTEDEPRLDCTCCALSITPTNTVYCMYPVELFSTCTIDSDKYWCSRWANVRKSQEIMIVFRCSWELLIKSIDMHVLSLRYIPTFLSPSMSHYYLQTFANDSLIILYAAICSCRPPIYSYCIHDG